MHQCQGPDDTLLIVITGAAGNIAQAFYPLLCSGQVFPDRKLHIKLLDIPEKLSELEGIKMQLEDCAFPLLLLVEVMSEPALAFKDIDVGVFLGGLPRKPGMERSDLLHVNGEIFAMQGRVLNEVAKPTAKILVVANPSNTNCATLAAQCPRIPKKNFTSLMILDHNRSVATLAKHAGVEVQDIQHLVVWGNHSLTQYPDITHSLIRGKRASETIANFAELRDNLIQQVQKRGGLILQVSKGTSTISGAIAVRDHLRDWYSGTSKNWTSFGVISDGTAYGVPQGLCFSMPVVCSNFDYEIVGGLPLDEFSKTRIEQSVAELIRERSQAD